MRELIRDVDRLLRGQFTKAEDLREGKIEIPVRTLVIVGVALGAIYGFFMGLYAIMRPENASVAQLIVSMFKVPLLFLLTLVVTIPSLYVFSALANSRLGALDTVRLLLVAVGVNLALLASLGPVTGFFTLSTDSYPFMVVLNVVFFAVSGIVGLAFLRRALDALFAAPAEAEPQVPEEPTGTAAEGDDPEDPDAPAHAGVETTDPRVRRRPAFPPPTFPAPPDALPKRIFATWTVIYGIVGAQMGWILRPFIGTPDMPFTLFRERESNFFESFFHALGRLFS